MGTRAAAVVLFALTCTRASLDAQELRVAPYLSGLDQPVGLVTDPSDTRRQFVIEKAGRIRVVERGVLLPDVALDLSTQVAAAGEQGLLGLAVDPAFAETGRIWVNFTRHPDGATVVARFARATGTPLRFDPATRVDLRFSTQPDQRYIAQPASNHNGGKVLFGADGMLYVAMGDGGGGNDQFRTAQDPRQLLGKMLRIDVHVPDLAVAAPEQRSDAERGYRIPPDNPFVDGIPIATRPEIWAFGLRNPWRVTLDAPALGGTGALLIGDVGQGAREEIDYEPAGEGGRNYGWPLREGTLTNGNAPAGVTAAYLPLTGPVHEYPRSDGISVTGGYVYRGRLLGQAFAGRYVFGDLSNRLRSVQLSADESGAMRADDVRDHTSEVGGLSGGLVSIDTDAHGELYLVLIAGTILRLTTTGDADGDGIDDGWAATFGLAGLAADARGPFGDPDGDGLINAQEFRDGSHPLAGPVAYFGEGANGLFATRLDFLNDQDAPLPLAVRFVRADGQTVSTVATVPAHRSLGIDTTVVPGLAGREFATVVEATRAVPAVRTMLWPATGEAYGSHAERSIPAPATRWYFAEGATTQFENVGTTSEDVDVSVYFEDRDPVQTAVQMPPNSRVSLPLSALVANSGDGSTSVLRTGVTVQARSPAARLYAEQATYGSTAAVRWARGAVARGQR